MPRGHLIRSGLGVVLLLLAVACGGRPLGAPLVSGYQALALPQSKPRTQVRPIRRAPPRATKTSKPNPTPAPGRRNPTDPPRATPAPTLPPKTPEPANSVFGHTINLPPGFKISVYVPGLNSVSFLAYSPDGVLFASLPEQGAVVAIPDAGQGRPGAMVLFAQGLNNPSGIAFNGGYVYVAETHQVVRFPYTPGKLQPPTSADVVVPGLPVGSGFNRHAIGFGPDGMLYVAVGASCNACREVDYRRATIMRYEPDGSHEEIYAQGLRDAEGLVWYPNSEQLLATNCSRCRMGDKAPADTIEYVYPGANFGWPFCHAGTIPDPELGWPEACEGVPTPLQQFPAQTTPRGLVVYMGSQFPADYYGDIFVALAGSWEPTVPVGYKIVRLNVEQGEVAGVEDFATGWLAQDQFWGRPVGLAQAPDGCLLVADDRIGAIYRIYYQP